MGLASVAIVLEKKVKDIIPRYGTGLISTCRMMAHKKTLPVLEQLHRLFLQLIYI
jgi:hypothetical protein